MGHMVPRLSGQTSIFGVVFFVSKSLLGIEGQRNLKNLQFCPEILGAMLEYWYIERGLSSYKVATMKTKDELISGKVG